MTIIKHNEIFYNDIQMYMSFIETLSVREVSSEIFHHFLVIGSLHNMQYGMSHVKKRGLWAGDSRFSAVFTTNWAFSGV